METTEEPLLLDVPAIARMTSLGKSKIWELIASGELMSVKVGARRLIPREAVEAFVAGLIAAGEAS
jgi:excisionase family DNA binding protein